MATFDNEYEYQASLIDFSQTHSDIERPVRGKLQTGRQRNHCVWRLPPGMEGEEGAPLWQVVALWVLRQGRAVTRDEIAKAFSVAPRRAADVMTYIQDCHSTSVKLLKEVVRVASGHRVALFHVEAVTVQPNKSAASGSTGVGRKPRTEVSEVTRQREQEALAQAAKLFLFQRRASQDIS